jgi:hypothetical protein
MSDIVTEGLIPYPGAKLLYRNASGLEKSRWATSMASG